MNSLSTIFPIAVTAPRIQFDSLWTLIILFSGLGITYLVLVFLLRRRLTRKENEAIVLKKDIAPLLSTLLFKADDGTREEGEDVMYAKVHVKELLKNPAHRKKISEILIDIRVDLPVATRRRILQMYLDFGLHEDAIQRLSSWRWEEVCRGINELTQMQVTDAYIYIRKFINDNRSIVRKQAQLAMVALKPEGIVYFMDHAIHAISEWQQLKILETMQNLPDFEPPKFRLWLTSKNQHVVLFAIRLIRSFDQNDAMESILKLVKHRDDTIKVEAINCIRDFKYKTALPLFKKIFQKCKSEVKIALLNALGEMGDTRDIPFLKHVERHTEDHIVKGKVIGTINALAPESILPTDQINESLAEDLVILEVGNIQDLEVIEDTDHHDEVHERFQDAVNSPDFNKHQDGLPDDGLCFDLFFEEDPKEIQVYAEDPLDRVHTSGEAHLEEKHGVGGKSNRQEFVPGGKGNMEESGIPGSSGHFNHNDPILYQSNAEVSRGQQNDWDQDGFIPEIHPVIMNSRADDMGEIDAADADRQSLSDFPDLDPNGWGLSEVQGHVRQDILGNDEHGYGSDIVLPDFKLEFMSYDLRATKQWQKDLDKDNELPEKAADSECSDFEKIFGYMDEDMKLAILADILQLGDERELEFLRKLRKDKSARVRRNSEHTYQMLIKRQLQGTDVVEGLRITSNEILAYEELTFEIDLDRIPAHEIVDKHSSIDRQVKRYLGKETNE